MSTRRGGHAALDRDDEVMGVVSHLSAKEVDGTEKFAMEFAAKDELVGVGARADGVEKEQRAFAVGARVVDAFAIGCESDGVVNGGGKFIFEGLLFCDAVDADGGLVCTALADLVGEKHAVTRNIGEP